MQTALRSLKAGVAHAPSRRTGRGHGRSRSASPLSGLAISGAFTPIIIRATRAPSWSPWSTPTQERARAVAAEFGAEPAVDYRSIIGRVDAASVAVPTPLHYDIARALIEAGIHVLVEKPLTDSVDERGSRSPTSPRRERRCSRSAISSASPAPTGRSPRSSPIRSISRAIASRRGRIAGVEVDVILDLMIHDIDMIIGLVDFAGRPGRCRRHAGARQEDRPRQCPHHLRIGLRRQRHREPGELQDRAAHAGLCAATNISAAISARGASPAIGCAAIR